MRRQHTNILLLGFGLAVAGYAGCSSGSGTTDSSSGATSGTSAGGSTSSTTSSTTSTTTGTTTSVGPIAVSSGGGTAALAAACEVDADCGVDLKCIKATDSDPVFGGGPSSGYCSKGCMADTDCPGTNSICVTSGGQDGICLLTCDVGPELEYLNDPLDPNKCHGRNDLRCSPLDASTNACLPTCGSDAQCPSGRHCDPRYTVCVDMPNTGKPEGAKCNPMASTPECASVCVTFTGGTTACSHPCVLGGDENDPLNTPNCGGPANGYCIYSPQGNGAGDYGFCAPACNKQDDCQNPTFWCFGLTGLTGEGVDNGYCLGTDKCPNGPTDCLNPKTTCTKTPYGPLCIDTSFPMGGGGTGGGSSTSATSTSATGSGGASSSAAGTGGA